MVFLFIQEDGMKYFYLLLLIVCITCFIFNSCNKDDEPTQAGLSTLDKPVYLSFINRNCQGNERGLDKSLSDDFYLKEYTVYKDTLILRFRYPANCCPAFVDSAAVADGTIIIALSDTLNGCRCMCDYENDFVFLYKHKGDLHVIFKWWHINSDEFITQVDTFILIN